MFETHAQSSVNGYSDPVPMQPVSGILDGGNAGTYPTEENIIPGERRGAKRCIVKSAGTIRSCAKCPTVPCIVHDISETGARLLIENVIHVSSTFRLTIEGDDFIAECVVVWRGDLEVGVIFQSAQW